MHAIWQEVWRGLQADFTDLPGIAEVTQIVVRLLLAALLGGLLGLQRELVGKAAGLRTHMLVAMGSAFFVLIPSQAGMPLVDLSRVLQGVTTGIGFLGAGAILKVSEPQQIHGLTTAAGLWRLPRWASRRAWGGKRRPFWAQAWHSSSWPSSHG